MGDADAYIFLNVHGWLECCLCALGDDEWEFYSTADLLNHIAEHRAAGHHIPEHVVDSLRRDQADNDAFILSKRTEDDRKNR